MPNNDNNIKRIRIEIDCDPMHRYQENYGRCIFETILNKEYREPNNTFFGCWTWCGVECTVEQQESIRHLLTDAYNDGELRYAGWGQE